LLVGDWYLRNRETDKLVGAIAASERVIAQADVTAEDSIPKDDFPSRDDFALMRVAMGDAAGKVLAAETAVADVTVLPWHRGVEKARDRYLAHARSWRGYFEDVAQERNHELNFGRIGPSFDAANSALKAAIPFFPLHGLRSRVRAITDGTVADDARENAETVVGAA
jgi:hypothetical protein